MKIEAEHQKVTVSGSVGSATLISKLVKAGKHAELWSPNPTTNHQPQKPKINDVIKNNSQKGQKQGSAKSGLETIKPKNNPKGPTFVTEDEDGDGGEEEDGEVQCPKPANQQQQTKKNGGGVPMNNGVNASKKVNQKQSSQNQNITAMRMRNAAKMGSGVESNEIGALMGLAGFNGAATNAVNPPNGIQQLQGATPPLNNNINGVTNHNIVNSGNGGMMMNMNMNGYNNHHHPMNMQNRQLMHHHQPQQIMYQRSAFVPASSNGCYYNYTPNPYGYYPYYPYPSSTTEQQQQSSHLSATNMSSDEETSNNNSCNIM